MSELWELVEYNAFAVQLRYEALTESEPPLDRPAAIAGVSQLLDGVRSLMAAEPMRSPSETPTEKPVPEAGQQLPAAAVFHLVPQLLRLGDRACGDRPFPSRRGPAEEAGGIPQGG